MQAKNRVSFTVRIRKDFNVRARVRDKVKFRDSGRVSVS